MGADLLEACVDAHARASTSREVARVARCRMKGLFVLGGASLVATIIAEVAVVQAVDDPVRAIGPYLVPLVGVVAGYASFRAAFHAHRNTDAAEKAALKADVAARVTHEVLDAHLMAVRGDISGLKHGQEELQVAVNNIAVSVGRIEGRLGKGG